MKYLEYLMWIAGIIAGLLIVIGAIAFFAGISLFGVVHVVNFYHVASSLLLLAICIQLSLGAKKKEA